MDILRQAFLLKAVTSATLASSMSGVASLIVRGAIRGTGAACPLSLDIAVPSRLSNGQGPTTLVTVRVTLVAGSLRGVLVLATGASKAYRRPCLPPVAPNGAVLACRPSTSFLWPPPTLGRRAMLLSARPLSEEGESPKKGPLVVSRMPSPLVSLPPRRRAGVSFAVIAVRLRPSMPRTGDGVREARRVAPWGLPPLATTRSTARYSQIYFIGRHIGYRPIKNTLCLYGLNSFIGTKECYFFIYYIMSS